MLMWHLISLHKFNGALCELQKLSSPLYFSLFSCCISLGTIFSSALIYMCCCVCVCVSIWGSSSVCWCLYRNTQLHCDSLMCFNSFWKQRSAAAQRNKIHQLLINTIFVQRISRPHAVLDLSHHWQPIRNKASRGSYRLAVHLTRLMSCNDDDL